MIFTSTIVRFISSCFLGIICGLLLYAGKQISWVHKKPSLDILFSVIRFVIFITFSYAILQFMPSDSILLLIVFLLSYVGTVITIVKKT